MSFLGALLDSHHFHAKLFGPHGQLAQDSLAVALLAIVLPLVDVFFSLGEHGVNQPSQLVGCRCVTALGLSMRAHMRLK